MDIPALSTAMAQEKVTRSVGVSMIKKSMDQMEQNGQQLVEMIKASEVPKTGKIDIKL